MEFNVMLEAKGTKSLFATQLEELEELVERDKSDGEIISYIAAESNAECGIYEGDVIHFKRIHSPEEISDGAIVLCETEGRVYTLYRCSAGIVLKDWNELDGDRAYLIKTNDIDESIRNEGLTHVAFCIVKRLPDIAGDEDEEE